eukprot:1241980-Rhodomonas_salina.1
MAAHEGNALSRGSVARPKRQHGRTLRDASNAVAAGILDRQIEVMCIFEHTQGCVEARSGIQ